MKIDINTYKHLPKQELVFDTSILTLIGKNGSGKSSILESIFSSDLDKTIISFSSGQNELYTKIYTNIKKNKLKQINKINDNNIDIDKFHFDYKWVRLLIFFATTTKNGLVRKYLKSNSYIKEIDNYDVSSKINFTFALPNYYISAYNESLKEEETNPAHMSVRKTYIQKFIEKIIENKINDSYDFDKKINKVKITLSSEEAVDIFGRNAIEIFTFISLSNISGESIFSYDNIELFFDDMEFEQLSDGEYQLLSIYALIDLFDNENTLFLLDEIDSHLHYSNINLLWQHLNDVKGNILTTTHMPESILNNKFENLIYVENGELKKDLTAKKSIKKISEVVNKESFIYQTVATLKNIVLIDDEVDWEIFKQLAIKKIGNGAENILNRIIPIKVNSGYNFENDIFGFNKIDYVQKIKDYAYGEDIAIENIFMICDKDEYSSTSIDDKMQCRNTSKLKPYLEKIKKFNTTSSYLLSWKRREILHYLLSYTMITKHERLNEFKKIAAYVDESYIGKNFDDDENIKQAKKENVKFIKELMTKEDGDIKDDNWTDFDKLREIINHVPDNEISDDITKMYEFIKNKVNN